MAPQSDDSAIVDASLNNAAADHDPELFTPAGLRRTQALTVLREYTKTLDSNGLMSTLDILEPIKRNATEDHPAATQVIGVGVGLLDEWFLDPKFRPSNVLILPPLSDLSPEATQDILAQARQGQAFNSLDRLITDHGDARMLDGTALAVAIMIFALAASRGESVEGVANQLLDEQQTAAPPTQPARKTKKGRPVSGAGILMRHDYAMLTHFRVWLREHPELRQREADELKYLLVNAYKVTINMHDPSGVEDMAAAIVDWNAADSAATTQALAVLLDYARFCCDFNNEAARQDAYKDNDWDVDDGWHDMNWHDVQDLLAQTLDAVQVEKLLIEVIKADNEIEPDERLRAYASSVVAVKVPELLKWLRPGQTLTAKGALRGGDVAKVAAMLGITATATPKRPPAQRKQQSLFADEPADRAPTDIHDVPMLVSWWRALLSNEVISITGRLVYPGPAADYWLGDPPLEQAELLIGMFISSVIIGEMLKPGVDEDAAFDHTLERLIHAIAPEDSPEPNPAADPADAEKAMSRLRQLEMAGLAEIDAAGAVFVPPVFRGVIARAVLITLQGLDELEW